MQAATACSRTSRITTCRQPEPALSPVRRRAGADDQARARSAAAEATADRIRQESERDAAIIWADVQALEQQLVALEAAYVSARQTRDVVFRRFAALRGTLFDVADAQSAYLSAAIAYIEGLTQLDASRYVLLARTGRLLEQFDMEGQP